MYNCIKSLTVATSSHRYGYTLIFHHVPENKIDIVDDTVKTLNTIAQDRNYITMHVSSFLN